MKFVKIKLRISLNIHQGLKAASVFSKEFLSPKKFGETLSFLSECLKCLTPEHTIQHIAKTIAKAVIPIRSLVI